MDVDQEKAYLQEWLESANMAHADFHLADQSDDDNYPHGFSLHQHHNQSDSDTDAIGLSETSSSSDSDTEGKSHHGLLDSQTYQMLQRKKREAAQNGGEGEQKVQEKVVPEWFEDQGFQYNGRVTVLALPGLFMVLALGGDMLLTVITMGALAVHLFHVTGAQNKTFIAYLIAFICTQLTVLYSAVPLLWRSIVNAALIIALNMYSVLTGMWLMLLFGKFRQQEPELAKFVESSLFSLYPAVCTVLITWVVATMTSISVAPYCLLLVGFGLFQVFLVPTQSSFIKAGQVRQEESYILDPDLTAAVALFYCVCPASLYLVTNIASDLYAVTRPAVLVEAAFLACLSTFLTTYLSWRTFMDKSGLPFKYIPRLRWSSGLGALLLLGVVLHCWGVHSLLLPWLPVILSLHVSLAFLLIQKYSRVYLIGAVVGGSILYACITLQLPWLIDYYIYGSLHLNVVYILLLTNGLLCLSCVYAASHLSQDLFGFLFLLQSLCTTMLEKFLLSAGLIPVSYLMLLSAFLIYVTTRLSKGCKLPWQHALLSLSVHSATLLTSVGTLKSTVSPSTVVREGYDFMAAWGLTACLAQGLWFEGRAVLSRKQVATYLLSTLIAGILNGENLGQLMTLVTSQDLGITELSALLICMVGAMGLKLYTCHQCDMPYGKHVSVITMVIGLVVLCVQPTVTLTWEDASIWLAISSLLLGIGLISMVRKVKVSMATILIPSTLIGIPLGLGVPLVIYQTSLELVVYLAFSAVTTLCICLSLAVWLQPGVRDKNVKLLLVALTLVCASFAIYDFVQLSANLTPRPGSVVGLLGSLGSAVVLKLHSLWNQAGHMTSRGDLYISRLPLLGNLATCASFIILVIICPISEWHAWVCLCSKIWFLLQKDNVLIYRKSRDSHWAPTALTITYSLFAMTLYSSHLWTSKSTWTSFLGLMEVSIVILTVPTYVIFTSVVWRGTVAMSDRRVVFLMPLNFVLLLIGSSHTCRFHAACGILFCLWLMKYRLKLKVIR